LDLPQYAVISASKLGSLGPSEQPSFWTSDDSDICNPGPIPRSRGKERPRNRTPHDGRAGPWWNCPKL